MTWSARRCGFGTRPTAVSAAPWLPRWPAEILKRATLDSATYLGQDQRLGPIEKGKLADFFLVPGDPAQDLKAIKTISMVVKDGAFYCPSEVYPKFGNRAVYQRAICKVGPVEGCPAVYPRLRRATMAHLATALAALGIALPLNAQWLHYPTPGIPRTANGKPNLSAPAPRTADGHPDLSGIWEHMHSRDSAYYLKGIDFPWQPAAKAEFEERKANNQKDNPEGQCLPRGLPKADAFDIHKIVQTPGLIVILYEYGTTFRQIFTDGRPLPKDPNPSWMGNSIGHWEGDTLVVESNGFNGKAWLSFEGVPISDALHLTERMRRRDFGRMDIQLTIDDPKAYTKPWTTELHPELVPDTELIEFVCNENEKDARHLVGQ